MTSKPLVSVIIPTYNRRSTICRAVDSVLGQTWKNIEVIVVDDGSKDDTAAVLEPYGNKIRLLRQQNQGQSAARNNGIKAATGDIISFLDSDDMWLPEKTERQANLLLKTRSRGVKCSVCNAKMIYTSGLVRTSFKQAALEPELEEGIWANPGEVLMTRFLLFNQVADIWRDALEEAGSFRSDLRHHEDYDLELRVALLGPWAFIKEPLAVWYGSDEPSESKNASVASHCDAVIGIIKQLRSSPKWGPLMPKQPMRHRLSLLTLQTNAHRLAKGTTAFQRIRGEVMLKLTRISNGLYRRSGWLPKMITQPAGA